MRARHPSRPSGPALDPDNPGASIPADVKARCAERTADTSPRYPVNCTLKGVPVACLRGGRPVETQNWRRVLKHIARQEKNGGAAHVRRYVLDEPIKEHPISSLGKADRTRSPRRIVETADVDFIALV